MNKILLDFDGVLFHNKYVHDYIALKSIDYVRTRSNTKFEDAIFINKHGYTKHGHSALIYGNNPTSIHMYNHHVYNQHSNLLKKLIKTSITKEDSYYLRDLMSMKDIYGHEFVLCTNTPKWYCEYILNMLDTSCEELFRNDVFTSDNGRVKPCKEYYDNIENRLRLEHYRFVDDSILNIQGIGNRENWTGYLVHDKNDILDLLSQWR